MDTTTTPAPDVESAYCISVYECLMFGMEADAMQWRGSAEFLHADLETRERTFNKKIVPVIVAHGSPAPSTEGWLRMTTQARATIAGATIHGMESAK